MTELIKVNGIYWKCEMLAVRTPDMNWKPRIVYQQVKVVAVDTERETVDYDYVGDHRKVGCSTETFLASYGETKKEAFQKELAQQKERLKMLKEKIEYFEKEGCKDES